MTKAGERLIAGAKEALEIVKAMKPLDDRPAKLGWAPGSYMARCVACSCHFAGDKRAYHCADCAYQSIEA